MDITEVSILHHVAVVVMALWLLSVFSSCNLLACFLALLYLYQVHGSYIMRLRKKLQFEERQKAYQSRVLSDSETVRWLNQAVQNIWSICMEQIVSQHILLPIIPWFLEKYKPWTADIDDYILFIQKKIEVQHMYLGRNPPIFSQMRVRQCHDDHLVLELGMNFLTADDMSAILAVKLRKRLGFGMWATMHITSMHIEGKCAILRQALMTLLVGVKLLQKWPFLSRLRICFVEPPYVQINIKPMSNHGPDVTDIPGISGWMDNLLSIAFEQTLVEPNMLVVDVEKLVSPKPDEPWFSFGEKGPVAYAKVVVIEASDIPPSDRNGCYPSIGLASPYVKGRLNGYKFKTKPQMKTLTPKWLEEFKIPIIAWESPNILAIEVCDKDHLYHDTLGYCSVNISDCRGFQKHDMWLPLQNIKSGRLHLTITILDGNRKGIDDPCDKKPVSNEERRKSCADETDNGSSFSSVLSKKSQKVADSFELVDAEGQKETGIWIHHPGSEIFQTWMPRKGKSRRPNIKIHGEINDLNGSCNSNINCSCPNDNPLEKHKMKSFKRGLHKIGSVFCRSPREEQSGGLGEAVQSPYAKIGAVDT
ncbi:C2 domain-containing protein [Senna tora]|uniref:C2 domain-containing protein n=1 Tax=Senna tora TaxID=362788 RepID=A0A834X1S9_9FABA|nr:C2 domain-containing protein [Senna tora]